MKRILFALIFLASTSLTWAQVVSPTINYQGRAQDGDGNAVTGDRQVTLSIYDAATGGTALFSETHPSITFSTLGTFTVRIGGATPGGIPPTIGFDQPRWIGVTVTGFNDGNELPRLRFLGSPYSFVANVAFRADSSRIADSARSSNRADRAINATFADTAVAADRAVKATEATSAETATVAETLNLPATLDNPDKAPTLTVINPDTGPALAVDGGLEARGEPYAIITDGIDSTTGHYAAGEVNDNTGIPDPGALYRDNIPLAWGQIEADGTILADFGIKRVGHSANNPGVYQIILDNPVAMPSKVTPEFAIVLTPFSPAGITGQMLFGSWDYDIDQSTDLPRDDAFLVNFRNQEFGQDVRFSVVVFGRPAK